MKRNEEATLDLKKRWDLLVVQALRTTRSDLSMFEVEKSKAPVFGAVDAIPDFILTYWDGVGITIVLGRRKSGKSTFVETRLGPWRKIGREFIRRHEFGFCWRGGNLHHGLSLRPAKRQSGNILFLHTRDSCSLLIRHVKQILQTMFIIGSRQA